MNEFEVSFSFEVDYQIRKGKIRNIFERFVCKIFQEEILLINDGVDFIEIK